MSRYKPFALIILVVLSFSIAVLGQEPAQTTTVPPAPETQPRTEQRKTSEPYTGDLSIFETPGRDERLQIGRVMNILGIESGKGVADIGAGSGWFTVRAAKRVGAGGEVYAVDINPEAIRHIEERARKEQLPNVKTILSKPDDPLLPAGFGRCRVAAQDVSRGGASGGLCCRNCAPALRPGAKIGVIDRNGNGEDHGVGRDVVIREAKRGGIQTGQAVRLREGRQDGLLPGLHCSTVTSSTTDHVVRDKSAKAGRSASEAVPCGLAHAGFHASPDRRSRVRRSRPIPELALGISGRREF